MSYRSAFWASGNHLASTSVGMGETKERTFNMRSSNPVISTLTRNPQQTAQQGYVQQGYGQGAGTPPYQMDVDSRQITVDDIISKTGITLGVIVVFAAVNFYLSTINPGITLMLTGLGAIGGLITVLVSSLGRKYGPVTTLAYAVFEGLFVGGISMVFSGVGKGGVDVGTIIGQAVMGTVGVFLGMLWAYKSGAIKVTAKFNRILTGCLVGVIVLAIGNLLGSLIFHTSPLTNGGPIAIVFSLVCIVLASLSFLTDFDNADRLVRQGAPAKVAWGVALGLAVTLVWLYTEILRLLSYFRN